MNRIIKTFSCLVLMLSVSTPVFSASNQVQKGTIGQPAVYTSTNTVGSIPFGGCLTNNTTNENTTNFISQNITGSSATITGEDGCGTVYIPSSNTNAVAIISASAASSGLTSGFAVTVENHGSATATWTPSSGLINGSASFPIPAGTGCSFWSDNTNFQVFKSQCSALPLVSSNLPINVTSRTITLNIDGSGTTPSTGKHGCYWRAPFGGTITGWSLTSDITGSAVVDVWKVAGGSPGALTLPTISNTITASALPTLTSQQSNYSTTLTGWTPTVSTGDVFCFNLNSVNTLTYLVFELYITTN